MTAQYFLTHMHLHGMTKDDVLWLLAQYGLTSPDELNADTIRYLLLFAAVRRKYGPTLHEAWATFIRLNGAVVGGLIGLLLGLLHWLTR